MYKKKSYKCVTQHECLRLMLETNCANEIILSREVAFNEIHDGFN